MNRFRSTLLLAVFIWLNLNTFAQDLESYDYWREKGITSYEDNRFEEAINEFKLAKIMEDAPTSSDIDEWIDKAYNSYVSTLSRLKTEADSARDAAIQAQKRAEALSLIAQAQLVLNSDSARAMLLALEAWEKTAPDLPEADVQNAFSQVAREFLGYNLSRNITLSPEYDWQARRKYVRENPNAFFHKDLKPVKPKAYRINPTYLLTQDGDVIVGYQTGQIIGQRIRIEEEFSGIYEPQVHSSGITAIDISPSRELYLSAGADGFVKLWTFSKPNLVPRISLKPTGAKISQAYFVKDDYVVITTTAGEVGMFTPSGKQVYLQAAHSDEVSGTASFDEGRIIYSGSPDGKLVRHSPFQEQPPQPINWQGGQIMNMATDSADQQFAVGSHTGVVSLLEAETEMQIGTYPVDDLPVRSVSFYRDQQEVFLLAHSDIRVKVWKLPDQLIWDLPRETFDWKQVLMRDSSTLVTLNTEGQIGYWNRNHEATTIYDADATIITKDPNFHRIFSADRAGYVKTWHSPSSLYLFGKSRKRSGSFKLKESSKVSNPRRNDELTRPAFPNELKAFANSIPQTSPTSATYAQISRKFQPPGTVLLGDSLFVDELEVGNIDYREFLQHLTKRKEWVADAHPIWSEYTTETWQSWLLPDTTVWIQDLVYNQPMVDNYFRHPIYSRYPVVGVSYEQARLYCKWRSEVVTQLKRRQNKSPYDYIYTYRLPTYQEWTQIAFQTELLTQAPELYVETEEQTPRFWQEPIFPKGGPLDIGMVQDGFDQRFRDQKTRLYHIIGNVSEMVYEKGIAKGGNWQDEDQEAIYACYRYKSYSAPANWLGFRCVCEVSVIPRSAQQK